MFSSAQVRILTDIVGRNDRQSVNQQMFLSTQTRILTGIIRRSDRQVGVSISKCFYQLKLEYSQTSQEGVTGRSRVPISRYLYQLKSGYSQTSRGGTTGRLRVSISGTSISMVLG